MTRPSPAWIFWLGTFWLGTASISSPLVGSCTRLVLAIIYGLVWLPCMFHAARRLSRIIDTAASLLWSRDLYRVMLEYFAAGSHCIKRLVPAPPPRGSSPGYFGIEIKRPRCLLCHCSSQWSRLRPCSSVDLHLTATGRTHCCPPTSLMPDVSCQEASEIIGS